MKELSGEEKNLRGRGAEVLKMGEKRKCNLASEVCHLYFNLVCLSYMHVSF